MRINIDPRGGGTLVLEEVYNSIVLRTIEGNELAICMRDDTFELTIVGSDKWWRVNTRTKEFRDATFEELSTEMPELSDSA